MPTQDFKGSLNLGQVPFPATQNSSADANTLDDYDEYTAASADCTGAVTATVVWKLVKVGNVVTLYLPATQSAGVAEVSFSYGTVVPAKSRPVANMVYPVVVTDDAVTLPAPGLLSVIAATGVITVYKTLVGDVNFTVTAAAGLAGPTCVSWLVA